MNYDIELLNKFCNQYLDEVSFANVVINNAKEEVLTNFKPDFQKFFQEEALYKDIIKMDENGNFIEEVSEKTLEEAESFYTNINTVKHKVLLAAYDLYCARIEEDYIIAGYNLGRHIAFIHNYEKTRCKLSNAGKAKAKRYKNVKSKIIEYAQNLLRSSSTRYTIHSLTDKITNRYILGDMQGIKFDTDNPKSTIYRWIKSEWPNLQNNEKKIKAEQEK